MARKSVLVAIGGAAICVAYCAGGVHGFGQGYAAALFSRSGEITADVTILRRLNSGDLKPAQRLLEVRLDGLIVANHVGRPGFRSVFNLPRLLGVASEAVIDRNAAAAIGYRAEVPSPPYSVKPPVGEALESLARNVERER
jgi:hypothetical protein